jgi:hypothetical protein
MSQRSILIVVDIQKEFAKCFNEEYIKKVKEYIKRRKWLEVIVIVDMNEDVANIPLWMYEKADQIIQKRYGGDKGYIEEMVSLSEANVERDNESWRVYNNQLVITTSGCHETFDVPEDLERYCEKIKENKVTLIGGCENECLQDIYDTLLYYDINTTINHQYTYNGYNQKNYNFLEDDFNLVEIQ